MQQLCSHHDAWFGCAGLKAQPFKGDVRWNPLVYIRLTVPFYEPEKP